MITPSFSLTATERVLPKLALDFTTASLDPRVTFTRTTDATHPATYVNSSGVITAATNNQPRFDYNPITLSCKGLLIEESRSNICTGSESFDDALQWTPINVTPVANTTIAPDGATTGDSLYETTTTAQHRVDKTLTNGAGDYAVSCFFKAAGSRYAGLRFSTGSAYIDLTTGIVTNVAATSVTSTSYGNGWYRVEMYVAGAAANSILRINNSGQNASAFATYSGDPANAIVVWGAQVEAGAFATSYIPTTTTALTRNADVATMTGTNFSDWYNTTQGTMFAQYIPYVTSNLSGVFSINNGGSSNAADWRPNSGDFTVTSGGATQADMYPGGVTVNTVGKGILAMQLNNMACCKNAGTVLTDTTALMPVGVNRLDIGTLNANPIYNIDGWIQKIEYWPQRLTNAELQAFTK